MHGGPAQGLMGHFLIRDRLHDVRAGHIHVGGVLHHEDEVGHRGRVNIAPGARAHDDGNLRDDAGGEHILHENVRIPRKAVNALLDARATSIEQADDRGAVARGHLLHLDDLLGMGAAERATENGEVLGEDIDEAPIDRAMAGDDAVAGNALILHAEIGAAMLHEHVVFLEAALIEQHMDPLARRQLALGVLGLDPGLAAADAGAGPFLLQSLDKILHGALLPSSIRNLRSSTRYNSVGGTE